MGYLGLSGISVGTISLKCFDLDFKVGLWIGIVNPLSLSVGGAKVLSILSER